MFIMSRINKKVQFKKLVKIISINQQILKFKLFNKMKYYNFPKQKITLSQIILMSIPELPQIDTTDIPEISNVSSQIFRKPLTKEIIAHILAAFGLSGVSDTRFFTRAHLETINTVDKLLELSPYLKEFYIPCKARQYLNDLNTKNSITILRQILREVSYQVLSKEKYSQGQKYNVYRIVPKINSGSIEIQQQNTITNVPTRVEGNLTLSFD